MDVKTSFSDVNNIMRTESGVLQVVGNLPLKSVETYYLYNHVFECFKL